jgi:hypothetical protein
MSPMLIRRLVAGLSLAAAIAAPSAMAKQPQPEGGKAPQASDQATVRISVGKLKGGKAPIYGKVPVYGTVQPFAPGQSVDVTFYLDGHKLLKRRAKVSRGSGDAGVFKASIVVREAGKYAASAHVAASGPVGGDTTVRKSWKVSFPALHEGQCGNVVVGFKKAMRKMGYIANDGRCFGGKTARGVLAYRKVNDMSRSMRAGKGLVKRIFAGKGEYKVLHPGAGEHLEAPLSKQVLVFAKGDKPFAVYPVSSGKSSTPTVTGHFTFIRQEPGLNSHGMYYSFYFYGGYAVHGYESVPDYPASHDCIRTFIADQPEIYERINFGEDIFVF